MMENSWAVDTNVLVYFLDEDSADHLLAKAVFEKAEAEEVSIVVCQQNVLELIMSLTKDYGFTLSKSAREVRLLLEHGLNLIHPLSETVERYLEFCESYKGSAKRHFDLYLAATLLDNGVDVLVTGDAKGFKQVEDLKVIDLSNFSNMDDLDVL